MTINQKFFDYICENNGMDSIFSQYLFSTLKSQASISRDKLLFITLSQKFYTRSFIFDKFNLDHKGGQILPRGRKSSITTMIYSRNQATELPMI